jgi:hypothetical protein
MECNCFSIRYPYQGLMKQRSVRVLCEKWMVKCPPAHIVSFICDFFHLFISFHSLFLALTFSGESCQKRNCCLHSLKMMARSVRPLQPLLQIARLAIVFLGILLPSVLSRLCLLKIPTSLPRLSELRFVSRSRAETPLSRFPSCSPFGFIFGSSQASAVVLASHFTR